MSRSLKITLEQPATSASVPKILVAEDAPDLRDAIVIVLIEQGYYVQTANDGLEATVMVPEFKPDLIVLDMRMPKMNGADACAVIRKTSDVPIIMFTSTNDASVVKDAILKGATDFVLKSTGVSILSERVEFHLAQPKPAARISTIAGAVGQSAAAAAPIDQISTPAAKRTSTVSLIVDPDEASRNLVTGILTRLKQDAVEASTAAEAVAAFKQHQPDILITEWSLPDMDAFNMLSEVVQGDGAMDINGVYKFIMSTRISPEAHRKARFVGVTNFLYKPLDSAKVEQVVSDCVRRAMTNLRRKAA